MQQTEEFPKTSESTSIAPTKSSLSDANQLSNSSENENFSFSQLKAIKQPKLDDAFAKQKSFQTGK